VPKSARLATKEERATLALMACLREMRDRCEAEIDKLELQVKLGMKEVEELGNDRGEALVTWKGGERQSVDVQRLKAERPDVYYEFLRVAPTRTLLPKWNRVRAGLEDGLKKFEEFDISKLLEAAKETA
jgi:hypothetical protein